jgi:hypothetical protein
MYADLNTDDKNAYLAKTIVETEADGDETRIYCAIPKLAAPLACEDVAGNSEEIGWTYCENDGRCDYSVDATSAVRDIAAGHFFAYRCIAPEYL